MAAVEITDCLIAVDAALQQFEKGDNWIKRRDAADILNIAARQIVSAARRGAEDADPDVAQACKALLATLTEDLSSDPDRIAHDIAAQRRTLSLHHGASASTPETSERGGGTTISGAVLRNWLKELAERERGEIEGEGDRLVITLSMQRGRSQRVHIDLPQNEGDGEATVLVYTVCGPPEPEVYARALESNARLSHAAFALLGRREDPRLILLSRRRLAGLSKDAFVSDVHYIARKGDQAEAQLHGEDKY